MKSRDQKQAIITRLSEQFRETPGLVLTGFKGLTVAQIKRLRNELGSQGAKFTVLKNTLARIASKGTAYEKLMEHLAEPRAAAFMGKDTTATLKVLFKFSKDNPKFELLEGIVEQIRLNLAELKTYSELPSRDEMRAIFLGVLQASMSQLVSVLAAPARDVVGVLMAYQDKVDSGQKENL